LGTGDGNTLLGHASIPSSSSDTRSIVIGACPSAFITGKGSCTGFISPGGGGVFQGNNSSTWSTVSDQRIKKNIGDYSVGLEVMRQLRVRNFEYRKPEEITELPEHAAVQKEGLQIGLIAQEVLEVLPEIVKQESTGVYSVSPDNLTWYMINAIKELDAENTLLKAEIAAIKAHVGISTQ